MNIDPDSPGRLSTKYLVQNFHLSHLDEELGYANMIKRPKGAIEVSMRGSGQGYIYAYSATPIRGRNSPSTHDPQVAPIFPDDQL